jgi:putative addiction module component (TIGR02574 family)
MPMTDPTKSLNEALQLPLEARAALAARLIDSFDADVDEDAEAAWHAEIDRRLAEIDDGPVSPTPWSEVRESIMRR